MYMLALLTSVASWISLALSIGCGEFQTLSTQSSINASVAATTHNLIFDYAPISDTVQCNSSTTGGGSCNSTTCQVKSQPNVFITLERIFNVSVVSLDVANQIFELIRGEFPNSENVNTNASWVYRTNGGTIAGCINEGETAYWGYAPSMSCVTGTVNACESGSGLDNGTVIYACGVLTMGNTVNATTPLLDWGFVQLEREASGSPGMPLHNGTAPTPNGAVGETDMVKSKVLGMSILVGVVAVALAL